MKNTVEKSNVISISYTEYQKLSSATKLDKIYYVTLPDYPIDATIDIGTSIKKMKPKLCTQCGAPLHSNKCRFCDTEYC